ncbi:MAG: flagellar protein FlgN [Clostridium sp.]|uniref:flagellar protein FlgN n=1 Tax=Clostridium sp. TaxID=1506 RepID=UPI00290749E3|nr:flagellar protein FlgN [Clostridium sp.]MDU7336983.1 flagellar protein FlgN [Clostridium sp.]
MNRQLSWEFVDFLNRYLALFQEFFVLETQKYQDIAQGQIDKINEHVKAEEVFMLRSKGMEAERERLMKRADFPEATFRELLPHFDPEVKDEAEELFEKLSNITMELKEMNLRCNYLTELRLRKVDAALKKINKQPELQKKYDAKAKEETKSSGFISKKV